MSWILFYTMLSGILILKSSAQSGVNVQKRVMQISTRTLESFKNARSREELVANIPDLNDTYSIRQRGRNNDNSLQSLHHIFEDLPPNLGSQYSLISLDRTIVSINAIYENFLFAIKQPSHHSPTQVNNYLRSVTRGDGNDIYRLGNSLHEQIIDQPHSSSSAFSTLQSLFQTNLGSCSFRQSPQRTLFTVYEILLLVETRVYVMMQFDSAHSQRSRMNELHAKHLRRIDEISTAVKPGLSQASCDLWECDPINNHVEDVTFGRFTKTFTYMPLKQNEIGGGIKDVCHQRCNDTFFDPKPHHNCSGNVFWCAYYGQFVKICHGDKRSGRRLMFVEDIDQSQVHGKNVRCKSEDTEFLRSFMVSEETQCSWCFCACEYTKESHRYISLIPVTSTILLNKVITGIRYQKVNKVLYVQIQEGTLVSEGLIQPGSVKWKEIELVRFPSEVQERASRDYYALNYEGRYFDLDELFVPPRFVLTGVAIIFYDNGHMGFTIRATRFNYHQGLLYPESSRWLETRMNPNRKIVLSDPWGDLPTLAQEQSTPFMDRKISIAISASSKSKDAGQEAIPFIDMKAVRSFPPVPLVGLGMILKKQKGFGGFLAWRASTYNIAGHVFS